MRSKRYSAVLLTSKMLVLVIILGFSQVSAYSQFSTINGTLLHDQLDFYIKSIVVNPINGPGSTPNNVYLEVNIDNLGFQTFYVPKDNPWKKLRVHVYALSSTCSPTQCILFSNTPLVEWEKEPPYYVYGYFIHANLNFLPTEAKKPGQNNPYAAYDETNGTSFNPPTERIIVFVDSTPSDYFIDEHGILQAIHGSNDVFRERIETNNFCIIRLFKQGTREFIDDLKEDSDSRQVSCFPLAPLQHIP